MTQHEELWQILRGIIDLPPPARDPREQELLRYFTEDVPEALRRAFSAEGVFFDFRDLPATSENCIPLFVGEKAVPKASRNHKHSNLDWRFETASQKKVAIIEFCHPSIRAIWEAVRACAILAATTAVVAAILAEQVSVARDTFDPVFYSCLVAQLGEMAKEVEIGMAVVTEVGCWENHC